MNVLQDFMYHNRVKLWKCLLVILMEILDIININLNK